MESEENMDAGEGLVNFMPTEDLIIVGRLSISMPLNGSDADNLVYQNTTRLGLRVSFEELVVFCKTKLCDSRPLESVNGQPLEDKHHRNSDMIPITR